MSQTQLPEEKVSTFNPGTQVRENPQPDAAITNKILISIAAVALVISFFLPWATFFGAKLSGLDIQKDFSSYKLVWALPVFGLITLLASVANQNTNLACRITGAIPFCILIYSMNQLGNDVYQLLLPGAWLALASGAVLVFIPNQKKKA